MVSQTNIRTVSKAMLVKCLSERWSVYGIFRAHRYHLELN